MLAKSATFGSMRPIGSPGWIPRSASMPATRALSRSSSPYVVPADPTRIATLSARARAVCTRLDARFATVIPLHRRLPGGQVPLSVGMTGRLDNRRLRASFAEAIFEIVGRLMLNGCVTTATKPLITEAALRAAAGERSFERGVSYLDAVAGLETVGNKVIATVRGTGDYLVVLTLGEAATGSGLRGECGCPYGQEGFFCKHCVAVGLTVMRNARAPVRRAAGKETSRAAQTSGGSAESGKTRASDISSWLNSLSREELLAIVCDQVIEDDDWRRRLELRPASVASDLPAISARAAALLPGDDELSQYGYLEGPQTWHYARRVRDVTEVIGDLLRTGHPADAMVLAEQALAAIAAPSRHASDRAGVIGAAAAGLAAAHPQACRAAPPDPARLADFLAERMVSGDDLGEIDFEDYSDLLGSAGPDRPAGRGPAPGAADPPGPPGAWGAGGGVWAGGRANGPRTGPLA